jgi:hypothetical protein
MAKNFDIELDQDVVGRVLAARYRPESREGGPSRLTVLGNAKDSWRSVDHFRIESILLQMAAWSGCSPTPGL